MKLATSFALGFASLASVSTWAEPLASPSPVPTYIGHEIKGSTAINGPGVSGGGPSVVCRDDQHKIISARSLDLFDGNIVNGVNPVYSDLSREEQLVQIQKRLDAFDYELGYEFRVMLKLVRDHSTFLADGLIMAPGGDVGREDPVVIPNGCDLDYAGFYNQTGLKISKVIYDRMGPTDQAALWVHEALYKIERDVYPLFYSNWSKSSELTRQLVAYLFDPKSNLSDLLQFEPGTENWSNGPFSYSRPRPRVIDNYLVSYMSGDGESSVTVSEQSRFFKVLVTPPDPKIGGTIDCSMRCRSLDGRIVSEVFANSVPVSSQVLLQIPVVAECMVVQTKCGRGGNIYSLGVDEQASRLVKETASSADGELIQVPVFFK